MRSVIPIVPRGLTPKLVPVGGDKKLQGKICLSPYVSVSIGLHGLVSLCGCSAWQPSTVGNIFSHTLSDILQNEYSIRIRDSIRSGSYEYCDDRRCGVMAANGLNTRSNTPPHVLDIIDDPARWVMPHEITLAGDETCNLSCPSCRSRFKTNVPEETERNEQIGDLLRRNIFSVPTDQLIRLHLSTTGELFASPLLMKLVSGIPQQDFPNLRLDVQSNGLLAPSRWHRLGDHQDHVECITITIDAACADTYERLRRGGRWPDIMSAMSWLQKRRADTGMKLHTRMVVQKSNYREMLPFYQLSESFDADQIEFARLLDWSSMSRQDFDDADVFSPRHSEFDQALQELNTVCDLPKVFFMGGMAPSQIA